MNDTSTALESLKLIADWAKWLITIETGAIAIIGAVIKSETATSSESMRVFATGAIVSFVISIAAAAALLLTLPDIAQNLQPQVDVWLTSDTVVGRVFHLNTQDIALLESFFFGLGILFFAALILTVTWSGAANPATAVASENASTSQSPVESPRQDGEGNLQYVAETAPGSGGSPVFNESWQVIGVHWLRGNIPRLTGQGQVHACQAVSLPAVRRALSAEFG